MSDRTPNFHSKTILGVGLDHTAAKFATGAGLHNKLRITELVMLLSVMFGANHLGAAETSDKDVEPKAASGWALKQPILGETAKPPEFEAESVAEDDTGSDQVAESVAEDASDFLSKDAEQAQGSFAGAAEGSLDETAEGSLDETAEGSLTETAEGSAVDSVTDLEVDEALQNSDLEASNSNPDSIATATGIESAPSSPVIDLSPELRDAMERQFKQIRKLLETEDAFSESLGEVYLSYGNLLRQAGRLDESRDMLVNALHITKVNNGVNSIEQRPVLKALYELNFVRQNIEELEDNLGRIIWLEKKVPELNDDFSFDMIVRTGNHFLSAYLENPRSTDFNLVNLRRATQYFRLAVNKYGDRPLSVLFMPYGELAYANFLKGKLELEVNTSASAQRVLDDLNRFPEARDGRRVKDWRRSNGVLGGTFNASERYLKDYFRKAVKERDIEHAVYSLLNLGDLNILFGQRLGAKEYYEKAWDASQDLPPSHPIVASFDQPQLLPAFNFSDTYLKNKERRRILDGATIESVPLIFDVDTDGSVKRLQKDAVDGTTGSHLTRAKRFARRMKFRPIIENGKLVKSVEHRQDVEIKVRVTQSKASAQSVNSQK